MEGVQNIMVEIDRIDKQLEKFDGRLAKNEQCLQETNIRLERNTVVTEQNTVATEQNKIATERFAQAIEDISKTLLDISYVNKIIIKNQEDMEKSLDLTNKKIECKFDDVNDRINKQEDKGKFDFLQYIKDNFPMIGLTIFVILDKVGVI